MNVSFKVDQKLLNSICGCCNLTIGDFIDNIELLKTLIIDGKADIHTEDDYALRDASYKGHKFVLQILIDAKADIHAEDDLALEHAIENGHTDIVLMLINT
jgi:hypothetical protein